MPLKDYLEPAASIIGFVLAIWKGRPVALAVRSWSLRLWYRMTGMQTLRSYMDEVRAQQLATMQVVQGIADRLELVVSEVRPNGGGSMRDEIRAIAAKQKARDNTIEDRAIFETNAKGECIHVNLAYCRMTGRTLEELRGNGWLNAVHPADREAVLAEWQESITLNKDFDLHYRMLSTTGQTIPVVGRAYRMTDNQGKVIGMYGAVEQTP